MAALADAGISGTVDWVGCVHDRESSLRARPDGEIELLFEGVKGDSHGGLFRPSCERVEAMHDVGTPIRNSRQLSVLSAEELAGIAKDIGVPELPPCLLGANLVVRGIPDFTLVPPSSRLRFESGATIVVDLENLPCNLPSREIEFDLPGSGKRFKAAASRRRGVTAWVEREGMVRVGDGLRLFVPLQPAWPHGRGGAEVEA